MSKRKKTRGPLTPKKLIQPKKRLFGPDAALLLPMSPHEKRMAELGRLPREISPNVLRAAQTDIAFQIRYAQLLRRLPHWLLAQEFGKSGFLMSNTIRYFFREFNDRFLQHGPDSLPASFNVMEAFFTLNEDYFSFALHKEREHLLDCSEYFDWYASSGLPKAPSILIDAFEEGTIYSYDLTCRAGGYALEGQNSVFIIPGVSLIRHGAELSCLAVAGQSPADPPDEELRHLHDAKPDAGRDFIKSHPSYKTEDRYLEAYPKHCRVLLLARFDLRSAKFDVRYVHVDCGQSFLVASDDPAVMDDLNEETRSKTRIRLVSYSQLFSAVTSLIYLPLMFADRAQSVQASEFRTEMSSRKDEPRIRNAIRELGSEPISFSRTVRCLPTAFATKPPCDLKLAPPELEFESTGYWKSLAPGQVGADRDGRPLIGRTWVTRHDSWSALPPEAFLLKRSDQPTSGKDPGTIYIIRSPSHGIDIYKIGLTRRTPDQRAAELGSVTGAPLPFEVLANWVVGDCSAVEQEIHQRLAARRINPNREFFHGQLPDLIAVVNRVVSELSAPTTA